MTRSFGTRLRPLMIVMIAFTSLAACGARAKKTTTPPPAPGTPLKERGAKTVEDRFTGRFPGVDVVQQANGALEIRIRGSNNSFNAGTQPLYIIDDTPVPENSGGLLFLNPYDIEKIEVLKNPADTGLYGMRGANGVVKITTKRRGRT